MRGLRPLAVAGALLFTAGALVGWFRDLDLERQILAHDLVSAGALIWIVIVPLLLGVVVPFEVHWLRWAWLGPAVLVLLVAVAGTAAEGFDTPEPPFARADDRQVGLAMSLVGALVAMLTLLEAWARTRTRRGADALQL